jgi:hypothetical protein
VLATLTGKNMRSIDDIIAEVAAVIGPLLRETFEAGREAGARETTAAMKAKLLEAVDSLNVADAALNTVLGVTPTLADEPPAPQVLEEAAAIRATPGTVKPTIERLIASAPNGITTEEILAKTGFKANSVRGTLWTLNNDQAIEKRGDRWFRRPTLNDAITQIAKGLEPLLARAPVKSPSEGQS